MPPNTFIFPTDAVAAVTLSDHVSVTDAPGAAVFRFRTGAYALILGAGFAAMPGVKYVGAARLSTTVRVRVGGTGTPLKVFVPLEAYAPVCTVEEPIRFDAVKPVRPICIRPLVNEPETKFAAQYSDVERLPPASVILSAEPPEPTLNASACTVAPPAVVGS